MPCTPVNRQRWTAPSSRRMKGVEHMNRASDEGTEGAVADSLAGQCLVCLDLIDEQVPDATTLLKFRHTLEEHRLTEAMFREFSSILEKSGVMMRGGSVVDATFIEAQSSTKNAERSRDLKAHQAKKGNNGHFGYKAHTDVDAASGLVGMVAVTPANISDVTVAYKLVRKDDRFCYAGSDYTGIGKRKEIASDLRLSSVDREGRQTSLTDEGAARAQQSATQKVCCYRRKMARMIGTEHILNISDAFISYTKGVS